VRGVVYLVLTTHYYILMLQVILVIAYKPFLFDMGYGLWYTGVCFSGNRAVRVRVGQIGINSC